MELGGYERGRVLKGTGTEEGGYWKGRVRKR